ncbi:hypothetical protein BE20_08740 [Sorangium cellulosum]|nr:hypothetical protein BE20_08740 [Sorangium cellulosum]
MARLVDDLLDVSRVARGRIELRKQRCDLAQLLRQTAEDYRSTLEASGLALALEIPAEPLWVHGDRTRLSQAIGNVLHNASKFTPAGGRVTVALSAAPESSAAIRVRDTGIGMEAAMLARAFEPFSQADCSLDRSRGGLGLGLALVKGLVELHGGAVSAESAGIGRGTEVVLRLPLSREVTPSAESAAPGSDLAARSLRILIIEDNPTPRRPCKRCSPWRATGSRWPCPGPRASTRPARSCRRSSCATSASPAGWMGTAWRAP